MPEEECYLGTAGYDDCCSSYEEYHEKVVAAGIGDLEKFIEIEQPVSIDGNVYLNGSKAFHAEKENVILPAFDPKVRLLEEENHVYLELTIPDEMLKVTTKIHSTQSLGTVRIVDAIYDDPDANPIILDKDYFGQLHCATPTPGPIEQLKSGHNRIQVW